MIEVFGFAGGRDAERREQQYPAAVVDGNPLCALAQLLITDHEMLIEFFGKAVNLDPLLKNLNGLLPFPVLFPVNARSKDEPEHLAAQALTGRKRPGMRGIIGQEMAPVQQEKDREKKGGNRSPPVS